ncbi:MAG TPA: NAD-dependent epimerase/dehydratase family protein [Acidimicrobiia bacterium]
MRVLVTGGAGFIGSHVVDALVDDGHEVRVLDALLPAAHRSAPEWCNDGAGYVWGDVTDTDTIERAVRGIDAVSHQAAMVGLGIDFDDVTDYVHHNDFGTATLLRALHRVRFRGRLTLASSMVVYGEGRYRCSAHGEVGAPPRSTEALASGNYEPVCPKCSSPLVAQPVPETAPVDPRNVYAATKLQQEYLCRTYAREHEGVSVTALRYHNVYGPRMPRDTPYAGVASIFRSAIETGQSPKVFEDGGQRRDFVHVRDVARANLCALTVDESFDGPVNVASGDPRTVLDMANAIADALAEAALRPDVVGGYRLGDVRHVFASPRLAEERLGFRAGIGFEDGMREFARAPLRAATSS